jgi:hypothetical protein
MNPSLGWNISILTVRTRGALNGMLQLVVQIPRLVRELLNRRLGSQGVISRSARVQARSDRDYHLIPGAGALPRWH